MSCDTYDINVGEFDQKGTVATKYGDKRQLLTAMSSAQKENNIAVLLDVVVNLKWGQTKRTYSRSALARESTQDDRTQIDDNIIECEGWTRYTLPTARAGPVFQHFGTITVSAALIASRIDEDGFRSSMTIPAMAWNDQVDDEMGGTTI